MAADATYQPAVYRKQGGAIQVIAGGGKLNAANTGTAPSTGTLSAHTTSATLTGNDFAGSISIVTDGTGTAANVDLFTVTFAVPYANTPLILLSNASPGAGSASTYPGSWGVKSASATAFTVEALSAVTASSTVVLNYLVIGVE